MRGSTTQSSWDKYIKLANGISCGLLLLGGYIGAVRDADFVTWRTALIGTILLVIAWISIQTLLRRFPVTVRNRRITKLESHYALSLVGMTILLWIPTIWSLLVVNFTPLPFRKEAKNETLVVVTTFYSAEGIIGIDAHTQIAKRLIETSIGSATNLRVEIEPTIIDAMPDSEAEKLAAESLGAKYDASMIIWGSVTGVEVEVNFLNLKEPEAEANDVSIREIERTQIAKPEAYAQFITTELPQQIQFLTYFAYGQSLYTNRNYQEAIVALNRAIELDKKFPFPDDFELDELHFRLGYLHDKLEQPTLAIAEYSQAIELNPRITHAFGNRGVIWVSEGDLNAALSDFNRVIEIIPHKPIGYLNRGTVWKKLGDPNTALADFNKSIELDPEFAIAYAARGQIQFIRGELDAAINDMLKAVELDTQFRFMLDTENIPFYTEGIIQDRKGNSDEALANYNRFIALNPQFADAYYRRGKLHYYNGNLDAAIDDFARVISLDRDYASAYSMRGKALTDRLDFDEALAHFNKAVEIEPNSNYHYSQRGIAWLYANEFDNAIADFERAIELDSQDSASYVNLGIAWLDKGDVETAIVKFDRAIEIDPNNELAHQNIGITLQEIGETEAAISSLERAVELGAEGAVMILNELRK